jgi:hypothetical protein
MNKARVVEITGKRQPRTMADIGGIKDVIRSSTVINASGCWLWCRGGFRNGYGSIRVDGAAKLAHRVSFAAFRNAGEFPELRVLHRCDVRRCCNPEHLFLGTDADNIHDMVTKGRHSFGERCGKSILTASIVREIRHLSAGGMSYGSIAKHFGVSRSCVAFVLQGRTWRHVSTLEQYT